MAININDLAGLNGQNPNINKTGPSGLAGGTLQEQQQKYFGTKQAQKTGGGFGQALQGLNNLGS